MLMCPRLLLAEKQTIESNGNCQMPLFHFMPCPGGGCDNVLEIYSNQLLCFVLLSSVSAQSDVSGVRRGEVARMHR